MATLSIPTKRLHLGIPEVPRMQSTSRLVPEQVSLLLSCMGSSSKPQEAPRITALQERLHTSCHDPSAHQGSLRQLRENAESLSRKRKEAWRAAALFGDRANALPKKPMTFLGEPFMSEAFEIEMAVRDSELDAFGVVNNAIFSVYIEHGRHELLRDMGLDIRAIMKTGDALALAEQTLKFFAPLRVSCSSCVLKCQVFARANTIRLLSPDAAPTFYVRRIFSSATLLKHAGGASQRALVILLQSGDHFIVATRLSKLSAVRVNFEQAVLKLPEREKVVEANSVACFLDKRYKPTRIPAEARVKFKQYCDTN